MLLILNESARHQHEEYCMFRDNNIFWEDKTWHPSDLRNAIRRAHDLEEYPSVADGYPIMGG